MPPVGFKRSRALWDKARRPREKKTDEWMSLLRAILYELQPIRFSQYSNHFAPSVVVSYAQKNVIPSVRFALTFLSGTFLPWLWSTIRNLTYRQWAIVVAVVVYYFAVRWIHEMLDAGPLVMIITALVAIFTIGLGENADGELSAYSVFNRGFQRLLGSVDVEELVNQHVGGGMMMGGIMPQDMVAENGANDDDDDRRARNPNHRRNHANGNANPGEEPGDDQSLDDDDDSDDQPQQNRSRKSGKKARRKNREEKLEIRRQREAAMAMGFDGTGEDQMAMHRLIEEQMAANDQG